MVVTNGNIKVLRLLDFLSPYASARINIFLMCKSIYRIKNYCENQFCYLPMMTTTITTSGIPTDKPIIHDLEQSDTLTVAFDAEAYEIFANIPKHLLVYLLCNMSQAHTPACIRQITNRQHFDETSQTKIKGSGNF